MRYNYPQTAAVYSNGVGHRLVELHSLIPCLHLITLLPKHLLALLPSQHRERLCQAKLKQNQPRTPQATHKQALKHQVLKRVVMALQLKVKSHADQWHKL